MHLIPSARALSLTACWVLCAHSATQSQPLPRSIDPSRVRVAGLMWDLKALSAPPAFDWVDRDSVVASLLFTGIPHRGRPTRVFAYYSDPDRIVGRPSAGRRYPAVVLVHGGGGRAFPQWVARWAQAGYAAIAMDLSGRDGHGRPLPDGGPEQSNENKIMSYDMANPSASWPHHAVASVLQAHSLLLALPSTDTARTFLTGISWGGYLACMAAGLDDRLKGVVPVYGCGFLADSDVFRNQLARLTPEGQRSWLDRYDPSVYLPYVSMPVLFLNGNRDKHYNVGPYHRSYSLVEPSLRHLCIKPDMRHGHPPGWESEEIRRFFDWIGGGAGPLPKVSLSAETDSTLDFRVEGRIRQAVFHHSSEWDVVNETRIWLAMPVEAVGPVVTVRKPSGGFRVGFLWVVDMEGMSASGEFIIRKSNQP
jgi:dienelactone hydrolase